MRKLEFIEMENISGDGCGLTLATSAASLVVAALSGPFGWAAIATSFIVGVAVTGSCFPQY